MLFSMILPFPTLYMNLHALNTATWYVITCFCWRQEIRCHSNFGTSYLGISLISPDRGSFKWVKSLNCSKESSVKSPVSELSTEIAHGTLRAPDRFTVKRQTFPLGTRVVPPLAVQRGLFYIARLCRMLDNFAIVPHFEFWLSSIPRWCFYLNICFFSPLPGEMIQFD